MQLPFDPAALFMAATDISAAREIPLSVSIYIDETAPADLVAHVRSMFASSFPTVRLTVSYLTADFSPHPTDDIAIIVAGETDSVGACAADVRAVGVPVMVVTLSPLNVDRIAKRYGYSIPEGDIVSPKIEEFAQEPVELSEAACIELDGRIGRWIVSVCKEKQLSFAIAFPFMRRALARDAVFTTALQNAGIGLIPFIPGADLPLMTLNQAKMVLQIAAAYGQEMDTNRLKEIALVVVGAYVSRGIVRKLAAAVPVLGFVFRTGVAYASTAAIGCAIIEYFEGGEDVTGVANVIERATESSTKAIATVQEKAVQIAPKLQEFVPSDASSS